MSSMSQNPVQRYRKSDYQGRYPAAFSINNGKHGLNIPTVGNNMHCSKWPQITNRTTNNNTILSEDLQFYNIILHQGIPQTR